METLERIKPTEKTAYFNEFGRCIPNAIAADYLRQSRRYFIFEQPNIDYAQMHQRLMTHLPISTAFSAQDFAVRAEKILEKLRNDPASRDILRGVRIPFILPKQPAADIGKVLEDHYLPAVQASFEEAFVGKNFTNHHKAGLAGKLSIALGSRHERLLTAQEEQVLVGYYFPCLMEYSVPATIEQMAHLPEHFLLAGGFDTAAAMVAAPDLLLRKDGYPPVLWMAALDTEKAGVGYHFESYGYHLTFNRKPHFDKAAESWASGLVVLG